MSAVHTAQLSAALISKSAQDKKIDPVTVAAVRQLETQSDETTYLRGLTSVSPLEGREIIYRKGLENFLSESSLHQWRVKLQLHNLKQLSLHNFPSLRKLTEDEVRLLDAMIHSVTQSDAEIVAQFDHFGFEGRLPLEHDVKASEYFVRRMLEKTSLKDVVEFSYFPFTSEDINNLAYNCMLAGAIHEIWLPAALKVADLLGDMGSRYKGLSSLGLTHGQPASPTTMGKRFAEFLNRMTDTLQALSEIKLNAKCSGPVGNHNAIHTVCPEFDYATYAKSFVESVGFEYEPMANQRNPHLRIIRFLHLVSELNHTVADLGENIWGYISQDWLRQIPAQGHVGSSVMPQKVNPWCFEVGQGYAEISNALIQGAAAGLTQSRYERDLSDHPWERLYGEMLGYSLVSLRYIAQGLQQVTVNEKEVSEAVNRHPEVLAEVVQIAGRILGSDDPYLKLRNLLRGRKDVTLSEIHSIISDTISDPIMRKQLMECTPMTYIGKAPELVDAAIERYNSFKAMIKTKQMLKI